MQVYVKLIIYIYIINSSISFFGQKKTDIYEEGYVTLYKNIFRYQLDKASASLEKIDNKKSTFYIFNKQYLNYLKKGRKISLDTDINFDKLKISLKPYHYIIKADYYNAALINRDSLIYNNYVKAFDIGKKLKDTFVINESLRRILFYFF